MVEWLFLAVPWDCLRFVIVVFPDHTHLLILYMYYLYSMHVWPVLPLQMHSRSHDHLSIELDCNFSF